MSSLHSCIDKSVSTQTHTHTHLLHDNYNNKIIIMIRGKKDTEEQGENSSPVRFIKPVIETCVTGL